MTFSFIVSVISTVVTAIFAFVVLRRWAALRRPHLLAWGIGLTLYFIGTFSQIVLAVTWSPLFFGLWYWAGALMVAAWLGQGTAFLLIRRGNIARNMQMALLLVSVMTLPWMLLLTPLNGDAWRPGVDITQQYRDTYDADGNLTQAGIMSGGTSGSIRVFSPVMNIWGTVLLVGGAIYSAHLFRRKQIMRNRVVGNWLIAAGGLFPAFAGALIRLGDPSFKYFGEMMGAILIFAGFLAATRIPEEVAARQSKPAPEATGD